METAIEKQREHEWSESDRRKALTAVSFAAGGLLALWAAIKFWSHSSASSSKTDRRRNQHRQEQERQGEGVVEITTRPTKIGNPELEVGDSISPEERSELRASRTATFCDGVMSCVIPDRYMRLADLHDLPENQEIFTDPFHDSHIVFELMEPFQDAPFEESAKFYFEDLAESNEATSYQFIDWGVGAKDLFPHLPQYFQTSYAFGVQHVKRPTDPEDAGEHEITVFTYCIRIEDWNSYGVADGANHVDLVISFNCPVKFAINASNAHCKVLPFVENEFVRNQVASTFKLIKRNVVARSTI